MQNIIETSRQYYTNQMRNHFKPFVGYAPATWRGLFEHLNGQGFSEDEIVASGLCIRNERGKTYDRFRDVMLDMTTDEFRPIRKEGDDHGA